MIYDDYFWTPLTCDRHSYVAPSGEVLCHIIFDSSLRLYRVNEREFVSLEGAKDAAVETLRRSGKIPDEEDKE